MLPIFTAYLTPKDYGIIAILGVIAFLVRPIFGLGIEVSTGIVYFEVNDSIRKYKTIWTTFLILLLSSIFLVLLGFIFSREISRVAFRTDSYFSYINLYSIFAALSILIVPFQLRLQFEEKAKTFVILTLVSSVITIVLNLLFVVVFSMGVKGWILGTLLGMAISFAMFFAATLFSTTFYLDFSIGKLLLKYGYPMIPSFAFLFILGESGKYMLQLYRGLDEVGIYLVGYNMGMIMMIVISAFKAAWYPFFQSFVNDKEKAKIIFGRTFTYYLLVFGSLNILFFIFAKPVVMIMTQNSFHGSYKAVGLVAVAQFFSGVFSIFLTGVYYARKVYLSTFVQFLSAAVILALNRIIIPSFGVIGAAVSMAMAFGFMVFLQQTVNILGKFWIPYYEWIRVRNITFSYFFIICVTVYLGEVLSLPFYIFCIPFLLMIASLFIWFLLSGNEKNVFRQHLMYILKRKTINY